MEISQKTYQYFLVVSDKDVQFLLELLSSDDVHVMGITRDPNVKILDLGISDSKFIPLRVLNLHKLEQNVQKLKNSKNIDITLDKRPWNGNWRIQRRNTDLHDNLQSQFEPEILAFMPKSFDTIGNIAILEIARWGELSELLSKQKIKKTLRIVGETILTLHKNIHTVLRKAGNIKGEFRIRDYEIIAGDHNTTTIHKENNCSLVVDPTKMFFSPRLSFERNRVASFVFRKNTYILDCFAGCGPFSIQIAQKHDVHVFSVEKNPDAYSCLLESINLNRRTLIGSISSYLGDLRNFIEEDHGKRCMYNVDYIIMNLPERSFEFIPHIIPYIKKEGTILFFYTIIQSDIPLKDAVSRLSEELTKNKVHIIDVLHTRKVFSYSPKQNNIGIDIKIRK